MLLISTASSATSAPDCNKRKFLLHYITHKTSTTFDEHNDFQYLFNRPIFPQITPGEAGSSKGEPFDLLTEHFFYRSDAFVIGQSTERVGKYNDSYNEKSAQRRRKHCTLTVVRQSQIFLPQRRPPSRGRGTAKI